MGGKRGRPLGHKLSKATKRKIAESKTGYVHDGDTKTKIATSLVKYFQENHNYVTKEATCKRCGGHFIWDTSSRERILCDDCVKVVRDSNGGEYKKVYSKICRHNEYKLWRYKVLIRDRCFCRFCGKPADAVHHIISILDLLDKPELLYNTDIGITICKKCHGRVHWCIKYGSN